MPESTFLFENAKPGLVTLEYDNIAMAEFDSGKIRLSHSVSQLIRNGTHLMCKLLDAKNSDDTVVKRAATTGVPTYDPPGPQAPPALVNVSAADLEGVKTIKAAIETASIYGALLRAEVEIGRSVYIVPLDFTQEALGMAELVQLLHTKQVHYVFVKGVAQDCQVSAVGDCLRSNSWMGDAKQDKVSCTFADKQQLDLTVEGGALIAAPGTHVSLRSRAAQLSILGDGRCEMPPTESKDIRETDSKTLEAQARSTQPPLSLSCSARGGGGEWSLSVVSLCMRADELVRGIAVARGDRLGRSRQIAHDLRPLRRRAPQPHAQPVRAHRALDTPPPRHAQHRAGRRRLQRVGGVPGAVRCCDLRRPAHRRPLLPLGDSTGR